MGSFVNGGSTSEPRAPRRPSRTASQLASLAVFGAAALGVIQFYNPPRQFIESRGSLVEPDTAGPLALASQNAFGRSGEVKVLFVLPGQDVVYPVELRGEPSEVAYAWVAFADTGSVQALHHTSVRPLESRFEAPTKPGAPR